MIKIIFVMYNLETDGVKAAINKAKICKKPIAGYDNEKKQAYVEYANGERKYVNIENL